METCKDRIAGLSSDPYVALEHLVRDETPSRPGVRTCVEVMSCGRSRTHFCVGCILREGWTRIVASEKCWSGIEEKMPEVSREVN